LVKLAERRNLAVLGIGHVGKPTGTNRTPLQRILGSTGLGALARLVWMTAPTEERMAVGPIKSNIAIIPDALLWTRAEDGPVAWHGSAEKKLEDLLDVAVPRTPRADAEGFLRDYLAGSSQPSTDVFAAAEAAGITEHTLRRAADALGIRKHKDGKDGRWFWRLPDGTPQVVQATPPISTSVKLSNPIETEVAKLDIFTAVNMPNGAEGGHLLTTTPIFRNGQAGRATHIMEGGQLAHPAPYRSGQLDDHAYNSDENEGFTV
jgi:hypothetical protein